MFLNVKYLGGPESFSPDHRALMVGVTCLSFLLVSLLDFFVIIKFIARWWCDWTSNLVQKEKKVKFLISFSLAIFNSDRALTHNSRGCSITVGLIRQEWCWARDALNNSQVGFSTIDLTCTCLLMTSEDSLRNSELHMIGLWSEVTRLTPKIIQLYFHSINL